MGKFKTRNEEIAASMMYFEKTVAYLRENCGDEEIEKLKALLEMHGYFAYEISNEEFCEKRGEMIGSITIICDAKSVPEEMGEDLMRYLSQNGRLFIFDGPLFGNTDITKSTTVLEGVSPLYKTYREENCTVFETLNSNITSANFEGTAPYVVCPTPRPDGSGFGMGRFCRIIPVVGIKKEGGRANGICGSAAYFVLSDSASRLRFVHGTRLGSVSTTTLGSITAVCGMPLKNAFDLKGEKVISDMLTSLARGLFLFEAGCTQYTAKPGEKIKVGAKILSAARGYTPVTVRFTIDGISKEKTILAAGGTYTEISDEYDSFDEGEKEVLAELICDGRVIDTTKSELIVTRGRHSSDKNDFVTVSDGKFMLGGKEWSMFGINYFPSHQITLEEHDYWRGEFDKVTYVQAEVEKDLEHIARLGMNSVAVRIDNDSFDNVCDTFLDFLHRCAKHGLRVMFGYCNVTNPLYFDEAAFAELMRRLDIADDPTIAAYDVFWESGGEFAEARYSRRFSPEWEKWLCDNYKSVENAEKCFGTAIDRTEFGDLLCPTKADYTRDDPKERIKLAAHTRFLGDMVCKKWGEAIKTMKKYDQNHLYTNRTGNLDNNIPNIFISPVARHFDFMSPEAYPITCDEYGYSATIALDAALRYVSGGKPVIWAEYGVSLAGISGDAHGTTLVWDGERNCPKPEMLEKQREYQEQFNRAFKRTRTGGTLPWFYAGGFRFTEHSDCGYLSPGGENRPVMDEYMKNAEWFSGEMPERKIAETVVVDPFAKSGNWYRIVFGEGTFSKYEFDRAYLAGDTSFDGNRVPGEGIRAAMRTGDDAVFDFATPGDGTTSADTPLELIGGGEWQGAGALKYLNAEICEIRISNGEKTQIVKDGDEIELAAGKYLLSVTAGNTAAAKWLAGSDCGCASVNFGGTHLTLECDTKYLEDGKFFGEVDIEKSASVRVRTEALGRAEFGEVVEFKINVK